jgi:FkbM family methyltransferase
MKENIKYFFKHHSPIPVYVLYIFYTFPKNLLKKDVLKALFFKSKSKTVIIDCGANVGLFTKFFRAFSYNVYAFEPNPFSFNELKKLCNYDGVKLINSGAGINNEEIDLFLPNNFEENKESESCSILSDKPNLTKNSIKVNLIDFSKFILDLNAEIDFIKVDIEGYEVELIPHLIKTKAIKKIKLMYVELHNKKWPNLEVKTQNLINIINKENLNKKIKLSWH